MPTYEKAGPEITALAEQILKRYPSHAPLLDFGVRLDFVWARADINKDGQKKGCAIKHHGREAHGLARKIGPKDRAKGLGDGEVLLDHDWWEYAPQDHREALLDHELHHFEVLLDEHGTIKRDDLNRPKLRLRKHDVEFGWFNCIAQRHGQASHELMQARLLAIEFGQLYWPQMFETENEQAVDGPALEREPEPALAEA